MININLNLKRPLYYTFLAFFLFFIDSSIVPANITCFDFSHEGIKIKSIKAAAGGSCVAVTIGVTLVNLVIEALGVFVTLLDFSKSCVVY